MTLPWGAIRKFCLRDACSPRGDKRLEFVRLILFPVKVGLHHCQNPSTTIAASTAAHTMVRTFVIRTHSLLSHTDPPRLAYKDGKYIFPNDEVSRLIDPQPKRTSHV